MKIVSGDMLALTPPMGWNHWYAHHTQVTDTPVRQAADAMMASGMADAGYQYVSIDGCWQNAAPDAKLQPTIRRGLGRAATRRATSCPTAFSPT